MAKDHDGGIPARPFGTTGGGMPRKPEAIDLVTRAIGMGVTFIDNAWEYHDGRHELNEASKRCDGSPGRKQHGFPEELGA